MTGVSRRRNFDSRCIPLWGSSCSFRCRELRVWLSYRAGLPQSFLHVTEVWMTFQCTLLARSLFPRRSPTPNRYEMTKELTEAPAAAVGGKISEDFGPHLARRIEKEYTCMLLSSDSSRLLSSDCFHGTNFMNSDPKLMYFTSV